MHSSGIGFAESMRVRTPFGALGRRIAARAPTGGTTYVGAHADVLYALTRTALLVDDREAWRSKDLVVAVGVQVGWEVK